MGLTAFSIKAAKGRYNPCKLADCGNLHLRVLPSGQHFWRLTCPCLGRCQTFAFAVWPDVDLADA